MVLKNVVFVLMHHRSCKFESVYTCRYINRAQPHRLSDPNPFVASALANDSQELVAVFSPASQQSIFTVNVHDATCRIDAAYFVLEHGQQLGDGIRMHSHTHPQKNIKLTSTETLVQAIIYPMVNCRARQQ